MNLAEAADKAQDEFLWKGVLGIITTMSTVVTLLFGHLMKAKDRTITGLESKVALQDTQLVDQRREFMDREDVMRDRYETKVEQLQREKAHAIRSASATARIARRALEGDTEHDGFDEEDELLSTGVHDLRKESDMQRVVEKARETKRVDRLTTDYLNSDPPPKPPPYRGKLPSTSRRGGR